jgi:CRISPR-associated protein Cas1
MGNSLSINLAEDWATIDMVAQYAYCPRRFHLMYVEGHWEDNIHTLEGKDVHRRVDRVDQLLPEAVPQPSPETQVELTPTINQGCDEAPVIARSVSLGSDEVGLMGKLDLVSADPEGGEAVPVETKKSRVPNTPERSYPPERVQLMAQGLLLRAHGYRCEHGYLYYAGSRQRVRIDFTAELEGVTRETIAAVRAARSSTVLPPPLDDSPKCWGCSLCGICLPDETLALRRDTAAETSAPIDPQTAGADIRRLYAARDHATPFYVQEQGTRVGKTAERLTVTDREKKSVGFARLVDVSHVVLMGNVQISAQALHLLMEHEKPVIHLSTGGWFHGISHGPGPGHAYARQAQYQAAADPVRCVSFAGELVRSKIHNQRVLLQRNARTAAAQSSVEKMAQHLREFDRVGTHTLSGLLGWEGRGAALYFASFQDMLKSGDLGDFAFTSRNRRPPKDPVNALLSFSYALLAKECAAALLGEGLDPWWGLYHQPRHGRPALALDLMEPFRPIIADSVVITAVNTGMVRPTDFLANANGCALESSGRKNFLKAWEQRLNQLYTHPAFNYRCSWRTMLRIQARLLVRWLRGDIPHWPCPVVR